jgi:hypothetical protein
MSTSDAAIYLYGIERENTSMNYEGDSGLSFNSSLVYNYSINKNFKIYGNLSGNLISIIQRKG